MDSKLPNTTYENAKAIIMENNLQLRVESFKNPETLKLILALLDEFVSFAKQEGFKPILLWLPQKDDVLAYRSNNHFYDEFLFLAKQKIALIDMTENLTLLTNIDHLYSDDSTYGGHYSKDGNQLVADKIFSYFTEQGLFQEFNIGADAAKASVE